MSYLIALYVYYHGNNLSVFGITKGAREEDLQNKGLKNTSEIDEKLVNKELIDSVKERELKEKEADEILNYNRMMKEAQRKAQEESFKLHKAGVVNVDVYNASPDIVMDDTYDSGEIPLDFFSSINNF